MSGSFDWPPASSSSRNRDGDRQPSALQDDEEPTARSRYPGFTLLTPTTAPSIPPSSDSAPSFAFGVPSTSTATMPHSSDNAPPPRRRRVFSRSSSRQDDDASSENPDIAPPASSTRAPNHSSRRPLLSAMARQRRLAQRDEAADNPALAALHDASDYVSRISDILDRASSSNLRRLPLPDFSWIAEQDASRERSRPRGKRRKLDHDHSVADPDYKGFRYGYHGQVVPGKLNMEVLSCTEDGNDDTYIMNRRAQFLKDDKSVCSIKSSSCDLLLRHEGEVPFTLQKVVIKAPERGYPFPIQEGLIFIGMDSTSLLSSSSMYQIEYVNIQRQPKSTPPLSTAQNRNGVSQPQNRPSYYQGPDEWDVWENGHLAWERRLQPHVHEIDSDPSSLNDLILSTLEPNWSLHRPTGPYHLQDLMNRPSTYTNPSDPADPPPQSNPYPFHVTTDDDVSDWDTEEDWSRALRFAERARRQAAARPDTGPVEPNSSEDEEAWEALNTMWSNRATDPDTTDTASYMRNRFLGQLQHRVLPSVIKPVLPDGTTSTAGTAVRAPHAKFFIGRQDGNIAVKFDPPVSGKFVLLKLWSPSPGGNIDVQSIQVHGFVGPRYFPACEVR
ncbi:hypothetical protein P152DRAFT_457860 [Eremomyces bilateralis CBS 781.70]|uniref:Uncharacterized protein n=1 Tax=Eremomyces bilateralis CBS 781.70 TaxID=1392243 RepID=A0A6G1G6E4_9PEZI|nr:uncharacterized protein P152DRAFT_457860 [Eremomyces bilateralis CBS 781.70]KAF1813496.1 hypothetical protein P152DRAFT_457860 [Eremomyces bilateralis CBS 781.70]